MHKYILIILVKKIVVLDFELNGFLLNILNPLIVIFNSRHNIVK